MAELPTKEQVKEFFDKLDVDKSGSLTADDLKKLGAEFGQEPSEDEVNQVIAKCDASGDGKVSFEEFWEIAKKYHAPQE